MTLDIRIFWLVAALGATIIGLVVLLARRAYPQQMHPILSLYSAGMLCLGLCFFIRVERNLAGDFLLYVVSFLLSTVCLTLEYTSMCLLKQRRPRTAVLWMPMAAVAAIAVWFACLHRNISLEMLAINVVNMIVLGLIARTLALPDQGRRPLADMLSAAGYGVYALVTGGVIAVALRGGVFPTEYNFNRPRTIFNAFAVIVIEFVLFPLFLLMLTERVNRILSEQAMKDPLTDLYNRRAFEEIAYREIAGAARTGAAISVLVCDLDHFKQVNDRFGHAAGDQVLISAAAHLRQSLRNEDFLCRWGGDEFCALLPRARAEDAQAIAERVRLSFEAAADEAKNSAPHSTVSIGIATSESSGTDLDSLLKTADEALYRAKQAGRNRLASGSTDCSPLAANPLLGAHG